MSISNATNKHYTFESANMGAVEVMVDGEYRDGCKDLSISVNGLCEEFEETDDADVVMDWLRDNGVRFETALSEKFNRMYIQEVMIDRSITADRLLEMAATWGDEDAAKYRRLHPVTPYL